MTAYWQNLKLVEVVPHAIAPEHFPVEQSESVLQA
jgi:hypothetical protein